MGEFPGDSSTVVWEEVRRRIRGIPGEAGSEAGEAGEAGAVSATTACWRMMLVG